MACSWQTNSQGDNGWEVDRLRDLLSDDRDSVVIRNRRRRDMEPSLCSALPAPPPRARRGAELVGKMTRLLMPVTSEVVGARSGAEGFEDFTGGDTGSGTTVGHKPILRRGL